jgi:pilus assembly protein CpaB
MKKNYAPILVVAFAMAAICTAVFYGLIAGRLGSGAQANAAPQVLVASSNIARGSTVSALNVKAADWSGAVPEGALQSASQADGLTALADIASGEPIVASRLANKRNGGGLGIPTGMRAVSVQVSDSSGVAALLKPGLRVDVQAVYSRSGANQDAEIRTVLENIEVLKINPLAELAPGRPALPVATLLVTPADADTVGLADAIARVRLVLRNPLDQDKVQRSTIGVAGLMRGGAAQTQVARMVPQPVAAVSRPAVAGLSLAMAADPAACNPPK